MQDFHFTTEEETLSQFKTDYIFWLIKRKPDFVRPHCVFKLSPLYYRHLLKMKFINGDPVIYFKNDTYPYIKGYKVLVRGFYDGIKFERFEVTSYREV